MRKPRVFAVFVNFNDGEHIIRSTKNLLSCPEVRGVIIVDNGSTDGSLEKIKTLNKRYRNLDIVENGANLGFAKAANKGIRRALKLGADYVAPLNPDLIFQTGFITKLLSNNTDLTQFALKFKRDGKWVYDFGGKINWVFGRTYHLENNRPVNPQPEKRADFVSGGATIVRRNVYETIGLFDERFFMYFEDADFSQRAKKAGFTMLVDPKVIIEHKLEVAKKTKNWNKLKRNLVANWHFITKCVPWYFKPTAYAYWLILTAKSWSAAHF